MSRHHQTRTYCVRRDLVATLEDARELVEDVAGHRVRLTETTPKAWRFTVHTGEPCGMVKHRPQLLAGGRVVLVFCR